MARLPQIDRERVVTRAPTSSVSAAEVAAANRPADFVPNPVPGAIATALAGIGGVLVNEGERYERAANAAHLAHESGIARNTAQRLMIEAQGNVETFQAGWKGFAEGRLKLTPAKLRSAVEADLIDIGGQSYRSIVAERHKTDLAGFKDTITAEIGAQDDVLSAMARAGKAGSPEFVAAKSKVRDLYGELTKNPAFGVAPREAELSLQRMDSRHIAEGLVADVLRTFQSDGLAAARKKADTLLTGEGMLLSPAERRQYHGIAVGQLTTEEAGRRALLGDAKEAAKSLAERLKADPRLVDDGSVDQAIGNLAKLGGASEAMELITARARARFLQGFQRAGDADQVAAYRSLGRAGGSLAGVVDRIIGVESGGRADAKNPRSSATGAGQFIARTWLDTIAKHRPELAAGKSPAEILALRNDPALSREMTAALAADNAAYLGARGHAATPGAVYLAHFAGPAGAAAVLGADPGASVESVLGAAAVEANPFLKGKTASDLIAWANAKMRGAGGFDPAADAETVKAMRAEVTADTARSIGAMEEGLKAGYPPARAELDRLVDAMAVVDDANLRERLAGFLKLAAGGELLKGMPADQADALLARLRAGQDGAGNDGATVAEQQLGRGLEAVQTARARLLDSDPLQLEIEDSRQAPAPLDLSKADAFAAGLDERARLSRQAEARQAAGTVPIFTRAEASRVAGVIGQGGEAAGALYQALSRVPTEQLLATLRIGDLKTAIEGASRSTDPALYSATMSFLDQVWTREARQAERLFGEDVIDGLQDWQAMLRYASPQEMARSLQQRGDLSYRERREKAVRAGEAIARKVDTATIVADLDPGWFTAGPSAPTDEMTLGMLRADYERIAGERYAATGDEATAHRQAIERIATHWGRSELNAGRLTLYPPEKLYRAVDGSHDWMGAAFEREAKAALGYVPQDRIFIADRTTEADMDAGRPPTYLVAAKDPKTGEMNMVPDPARLGRLLRYGWDPSQAIGASREQFRAARAGAARPSLTTPDFLGAVMRSWTQ